MAYKTQKERIIEKIIRDGEIFSVWAAHNYILRLSERIRELIADGYKIETFYKYNKKGHRLPYAFYRITNKIQ